LPKRLKSVKKGAEIEEWNRLSVDFANG